MNRLKLCLGYCVCHRRGHLRRANEATVKQFGLTVNETGLPARTTLLNSDNCFAVFGMSAYKIVFGWDGIIVRAIRDK